MATLLEFPLPNGSATAEYSRYQKSLASQFVFWRAHEIQYVSNLLQAEFPKKAAADIGSAVEFARVVLNPASGKEALVQYVRGILHGEGQKLAA